MTYLKTCSICGRQWEAQTANALYCSETCRKQAAKERDTNNTRWYWHKYFTERQEPVEVAKPVRVRTAADCKNCVWRSWADHTKCVMPSCLHNLGAVNGRRA